jgi:hypothetical protein
MINGNSIKMVLINGAGVGKHRTATLLGLQGYVNKADCIENAKRNGYKG